MYFLIPYSNIYMYIGSIVEVEVESICSNKSMATRAAAVSIPKTLWTEQRVCYSSSPSNNQEESVLLGKSTKIDYRLAESILVFCKLYFMVLFNRYFHSKLPNPKWTFLLHFFGLVAFCYHICLLKVYFAPKLSLFTNADVSLPQFPKVFLT